MDNDQQAAILALIVTALKAARAIREGRGSVGDAAAALESDAIAALESLPSVTE